MKSMRKFFVLAVTTVSALAYGNTTWQPLRTYNTFDNGKGNILFQDMSYWTNGLGQAGSGAPTAEDDLVFDKSASTRLRFHPGTVGKLTCNSLQVGTAAQSSEVVQDGGSISFESDENGGLKFKNGHWFMNFGRDQSHYFNCDVAILAENPASPFVIHYGQAHYSNNTLTVTGKLKGSANAQLLLGPFPSWSCAENTTFAFDDISDYAGTITVTSRFANVLTPEANRGFGTCLKLNAGATASEAKLRISRGGSLTLKAFGDTATVKELSLACGSRLWFNQSVIDGTGKLWCVRATAALTVEQGADKVEIYLPAHVCGIDCRIPILAGPAGSSFSADDFKIVTPPGFFSCHPDIHLEVGQDATTGDHTLYVVTHHGLVDQVYSYPGEGTRDKKEEASSSLTNAASWRFELIPDPTNAAAIYCTERQLRTFYSYATRYAFPCAGFFVKGGTVMIQTASFEVPELWCSGGTIASGQGHNSAYPVSVIAPKMHFIGESQTVTFRTHTGLTFILKGDIDGESTINLLGWDSTGAPKCNFMLDGFNTNFTGKISLSTGEIRPAYHNFESSFPTLFLRDGRNLGGARPTFDPRALTISTLARLSVTNNASVTLEDGLNRGLYIKHTGRFHVTGSGTLNVKWPLLLSGKMWKEGTGTLVLGGELKHEAKDGGTLTDIPRAGSNLFEIVNGTVMIAHADALAGVETTIDAGASLKLALDPDNADLTQYGIRNTTVDTPFTLDASLGGKLPLTLDTASAEPTDCLVMTNALVTVKSTSAAAVGAMLSAVKPWRNCGYVSTVVSRTNADDTTTLLLVSKFSGMKIYLR
jgi:hypothetical protein